MSLHGFISFLSLPVDSQSVGIHLGLKRQETSVGCHFVIRGPAKEIMKNVGMPGCILHLETFFGLVWQVFKPFVHYTWFCAASNWIRVSHPKQAACLWTMFLYLWWGVGLWKFWRVSQWQSLLKECWLKCEAEFCLSKLFLRKLPELCSY